MNFTYESLLERAKEHLPEVQQSTERFEVPKVKGHIQGNKTIISNIPQIAGLLHRPPKHILKFLNKGLATKGVFKKEQFVVFNTKIPASRINEKITEYTQQYVICPVCKKPETKIEKAAKGIYMRCNACGSRTPLKLI